MGIHCGAAVRVYSSDTQWYNYVTLILSKLFLLILTY